MVKKYMLLLHYIQFHLYFQCYYIRKTLFRSSEFPDTYLYCFLIKIFIYTKQIRLHPTKTAVYRRLISNIRHSEKFTVIHDHFTVIDTFRRKKLPIVRNLIDRRHSDGTAKLSAMLI